MSLSDPSSLTEEDINLVFVTMTSSPLRTTIVDQADEYRAQFKNAKPYPWCVIKELCDDHRMRAVQKEVLEHLPATYKETDLFKLYQTTDFANVDINDAETGGKMPNLLALRDALYSPAMRQFISDVTGCGELSERVDCAANVYMQGSHLLAHDDVIGTRKVTNCVFVQSTK